MSLISCVNKPGQTQITIPCEMFGNSSVFAIHLQWNTNVCTQLLLIHQFDAELCLQRFFGETVSLLGSQENPQSTLSVFGFLLPFVK